MILARSRLRNLACAVSTGRKRNRAVLCCVMFPERIDKPLYRWVTAPMGRNWFRPLVRQKPPFCGRTEIARLGYD